MFFGVIIGIYDLFILRAAKADVIQGNLRTEMLAPGGSDVAGTQIP